MIPRSSERLKIDSTGAMDSKIDLPQVTLNSMIVVKFFNFTTTMFMKLKNGNLYLDLPCENVLPFLQDHL